ncbi:MAG: heme o synthase [Flavobacteriales bacterium]|nr:heme o synthase [Flavobacteriales bacterium]
MAFTETSKITSLTFAERVSCYMQLFKFKLTAFVVISAVFGYFIGAPSYNFSEVVILMIGGFLVTSSSNAFNQAIERNYDKLMKRTANRPLPSGKLSVAEAVSVASVFGLIGVGLLWMLNPLSGILGLLAIAMYVALYTPLKRVSTISVLVGAFPGAIPPMLGWVAATGSFSLEAGILFALQFVWQFPHFWAIAWRVNDDYTKAGFKMLPFGKKNLATASLIFISVLVLLVMGITPEIFGVTGRLTTVGLTILSGLMIYPAVKLMQTRDDKFALRILLLSYLYLILSLTIILIDRIV